VITKSRLATAGALTPEPPSWLTNKLEKQWPKLRRKQKVLKPPKMLQLPLMAKMLSLNQRSRLLIATSLSKQRSVFKLVAPRKPARLTKAPARSGKKERNSAVPERRRISWLVLAVRRPASEPRRRRPSLNLTARLCALRTNQLNVVVAEVAVVVIVVDEDVDVAKADSVDAVRVEVKVGVVEPVVDMLLTSPTKTPSPPWDRDSACAEHEDSGKQSYGSIDLKCLSLTGKQMSKKE
jgi:hypothetical protein